MIQKNMPKGMLQVFGRENEGRRMKIWSFTFSQTFPKFWQVLAKWLVLKKVSHGHYSSVYGPISCFGVAKSIKYWKREARLEISMTTFANLYQILQGVATCYIFTNPMEWDGGLLICLQPSNQLQNFTSPCKIFASSCKILQVLVKVLRCVTELPTHIYQLPMALNRCSKHFYMYFDAFKI